MGRPAGPEQSSVALKVEVEFNGIDDVGVDNRAGVTVAAPVALARLREETDVMAFPDDNDRDLRVNVKRLARGYITARS